MNNAISYGIIGFGNYAERRLIPAFLTAKQSRLFGITRREAEQARLSAQQYDIPFFSDQPQKLVERPEIEAIMVCSPPYFHREHALLAAEGGKHVLVEKPMAVSATEVAEMIMACSQNSVKFMAGFVMRFIEAVQKAREIVQSGQLGEPVYAGGHLTLDTRFSHRSWLKDPKISGGGPVADLGSHFMDLLQYITGREIADIQAFLDPVLSSETIEKNAVIILKFEGNLLGSLYLSFGTIRESGLTFHGSNGKLSLRNFNRPETEVRLDLVTGEEEQTIPVWNSNYYARMLDHFSDSILHGKPVLTPEEVGYKNQQMIDQIYRR